MTRGRVALLAAVLCLCLAVAGGYFVVQRRAVAGQPAVAAPPPAADLASLLAAPRIVFRDTTPGAGYSMLALVALADPAGRSEGVSQDDRSGGGGPAGPPG